VVCVEREGGSSDGKGQGVGWGDIGAGKARERVTRGKREGRRVGGEGRRVGGGGAAER
jgi:hypothetical protein